MAVFFGASEGIQPLFGQAYGAKEDDNPKYYYRAGQLISIIGSAICVAVYVIFPHFLCHGTYCICWKGNRCRYAGKGR